MKTVTAVSVCLRLGNNFFSATRSLLLYFLFPIGFVLVQGNEVANEVNDDEGFIQVLNDVKELFGEPVFLTH